MNSNAEILNKVSNLLNKTVANGCSEAESESAAKAAQYLLTKYRLSISDIVDSEAVTTHLYDEAFKNVVTWKSILIQAIVAVNGCMVFVSHGTQSRFKIVGKKTNIDIVVELFERLSESVEYHCRKNQKKGAGKSWANAFKLGFVTRISERLKEGLEEAKNECTETAIVKLNSDMIKTQEYVDSNMKLGKRSNYCSQYYSASAFYAGYAAGNSVNINNKLIDDTSQ